MGGFALQATELPADRAIGWFTGGPRTTTTRYCKHHQGINNRTSSHLSPCYPFGRRLRGNETTMASIAAMAAVSSMAPALQRQVPTPTRTSSTQALSRGWTGFRSDGPSCTNTLCSRVPCYQTQLKACALQVRAAATATAPPKFKTLKPLGDRVLVKIQEKEEKSPGGILLPVAAQTKPQGGEVVAIGDGKTVGDKKLEPSVSIGNIVVYSKYAGTEIQFNGADHLLLKEDDIIGLLSTDEIKDLQPLNERVLIKVAKAEEKTAGGIILTESAKEKPLTGTVLAVGPGGYGEDGNRKPLDVAAGNTVMYSKYAGNDFKSKDGNEYVVIRAADILAILP